MEVEEGVSEGASIDLVRLRLRLACRIMKGEDM